MSNWPDLTQYRSDHPAFNDPRYQRRVVEIYRPIALVENLHDVKLECGHEPLLTGDNPPAVGGTCFCPACYEAAAALEVVQ